MRKPVIIADSSPLITLLKINELDLLKAVYGQVWVTELVQHEVGETLPDWVVVTGDYDHQLFKSIRLRLDAGEASSIALALGQQNSTLIIDERKGRATARQYGLPIIGLLGVLIKAHQLDLTLDVGSVFDKILLTDFRVSESLIRSVRKELSQ